MPLLLFALLAAPVHAAERAGTPAGRVPVEWQNAPFMFVCAAVAEGLCPPLGSAQAALLKRFDAAMEQLRRDGTHDRLVVQALMAQ